MNWERLANFYVMVSDKPIQANSTDAGVASGPQSFTDATHASMDIVGKHSGLYVRIFLRHDTMPLSLAGVQAFGK